MDKQPTIAELRFVEQSVSLYGTVEQMSIEGATVRLQSGPATADLFVINNAVELVVVAKNKMFMASTILVALQHGLLQLGFSGPVRNIQRRKEQRVPIELDVSFRAVQHNGCFGLWKHGLSKDISMGGMCLVIPPGVEVPGRMEVLFMLSRVLCADQCSELLKMIAEDRLHMLHVAGRERPIKAVARASQRRQDPDGTIVLGLTFITLSFEDQVRLAQFLNAPLHVTS